MWRQQGEEERDGDLTTLSSVGSEAAELMAAAPQRSLWSSTVHFEGFEDSTNWSGAGRAVVGRAVAEKVGREVAGKAGRAVVG